MNNQTNVSKAAATDVYENYFSNRGVTAATYTNYKLPTYLINELPADKNAAILDVGCGFGQALFALKQKGYTNLKGIELQQAAVDYCNNELGLGVECNSDIIGFSQQHQAQFDFIIMSHVLEHLPKETVIATLKSIKNMLKPNGKFIVMIPNGQAPIHSYWMWEDFTHYTLFTAGSIGYVLRAAGFKHITFLDPHDLLDKSFVTRIFKKIFQRIYRFQTSFWNSVNSSGYHHASPVIYTWELKVKAII